MPPTWRAHSSCSVGISSARRRFASSISGHGGGSFAGAQRLVSRLHRALVEGLVAHHGIKFIVIVPLVAQA